MRRGVRDELYSSDAARHVQVSPSFLKTPDTTRSLYLHTANPRSLAWGPLCVGSFVRGCAIDGTLKSRHSALSMSHFHTCPSSYIQTCLLLKSLVPLLRTPPQRALTPARREMRRQAYTAGVTAVISSSSLYL